MGPILSSVGFTRQGRGDDAQESAGRGGADSSRATSFTGVNCWTAAAAPACEERGGFRRGIHPVLIEALAPSEPVDTSHDGRQDLGDISVQGRGGCVKHEAPGRRPQQHAVQHEGVDVEVEIDGTTESLNERQAATRRSWSRAPAELSFDRTVEEADDHAAEIVPPGKHVAQAIWERQHPLPHRHVW